MNELKKVIAEKCSKMMAIGLEGKPYHKDVSEFEIMMETWHEAITHSGYSDQDASIISKSWNELLRTSEKWFYPKSLMSVIRVNQDIKNLLDNKKSLQDLSDEQRIENLKKLDAMVDSLIAH